MQNRFLLMRWQHQNLASVSLTLDSRACASLVTRAMMLLSLVSLTWVMEGRGRVFSYCPRPKLAKALSLSRDCPCLTLALDQSLQLLNCLPPSQLFI